MDTGASQKVIVLADDDSFITHAYKTGLENAGYTVSVATDGEKALDQITSLHPDLVLMEMILPKTDGFAVLQSMQKEPELATIPVIALTNLSQPADEAEARKRGASDFLVKSDVSLQDVLVHIEHLLQ